MKITSDFLTANSAQSGMGGSTGGTSGINSPMSNFASLLQQSRAPAVDAMPLAQGAAPAAEKTQSTPAANDASAKSEASGESSGSAEAAEEAERNEAWSKPRTPAKQRARASDDAPRTTSDRGNSSMQRTSRTSDTQSTDKATAKADDSEKKTPADGGMPTWLAGWMPGVPNAPVGSRSPAGADAADAGDASETSVLTDTAAAAQPGRGRAATTFGAKKIDLRDTRDGIGTDRAGADRIGANDTSTASAKEGSNAVGFGSMLDELRGAQAQQQRDEAAVRADARTDARTEARAETRVDAAQANSALNSTTSTATSGSADAAATASAQVHADVNSPEFPQELGVKLSVLAKDGVQKAELHLNPAEMGPVSVEIVMDGTQARIDFGADVAATRQAIEAGLPELASALRDAGFTLAGGGVSQHAGSRQGGDGDNSRRDSDSRRSAIGGVSGTSGNEPAARVVRSRVSAGGVDLYA